MTFPTCATCNTPFADVPEDVSLEYNTPSRMCRCMCDAVHTYLTAQGLSVALSEGAGYPMTMALPDDALREGGWPVTAGVSGYHRNEDDDGNMIGLDEDDLPRFGPRSPAHVFINLYADPWAVAVGLNLFSRYGERIRPKAVQVLRRGVNDPAFRQATQAVLNVGGPDAFRAALLTSLKR